MNDDDDDPSMSPYGRCDSCGALCDSQGCTIDRAHEASIDPTEA